MSLHNAAIDRRTGHFRRSGTAAAANGNGAGDNDDGNGNNTGNGSGNGSGQGSSSAAASSSTAEPTTAAATSANTQPTSQSANASGTSQSNSTSASAAAAQTSSSSSSSSVAPTTTSTSSATSTSTSSSTSSATLSATSQTSSSTVSSTSQSSIPASTSTSTHISTVIPTAALATEVQTSSFASVSHISTTSSASAASSTSSAKVSGAINTGAVVGGIAGSLAAVAIVGFLMAFFLRRYNRKKRAARFEASQFRRSAMVLDEPAFTPRPPEMVQNRENNYISSVTSTTSPGMAGAGAYRFQQDHQDVNQGQGHGASFDTEHEYYRDQAGQQYYDEAPPVPAVAMQRAPLQPRQQYTFGQVSVGQPAVAENANPFGVDDYDGEHVAYGSQPAAGYYDNSQAYGNYAAYSPPQTAHTAGAHPSGQQASRASIIDESDAYGGI
ncbi:protein [Lentinula edodes]|uniref:Protein n=1 Tax=Lentinula edodes TaxID=5353 RepID=A0A1Q3EJ31_LENED|nr:protein [Lentinula edodes]